MQIKASKMHHAESVVKQGNNPYYKFPYLHPTTRTNTFSMQKASDNDQPNNASDQVQKVTLYTH